MALTAQRQALRLLRAQSVEALNGVELLSPRSPGCPEVVRFVFLTKSGMLYFLPVHQQSLRLSQPDNFEDRQHARIHRQICCFSRASGVIVLVSGPSMVSVVFRLVRSWLFCRWLLVAVCLLRVSGWLRLAEVFAVGSSWSVLLSVVSGQGILCGPSERWGAGRLFHRAIRLQAVAVSCAHVSCSWVREPSGMGANAVDRKSTFSGVFNISARSCEPPLRKLTAESLDAPEHFSCLTVMLDCLCSEGVSSSSCSRKTKIMEIPYDAQERNWNAK